MRMKNNYNSERESLYGVRIHSNIPTLSSYAGMFVEDITCDFSMDLSSLSGDSEFYCIESDGEELEKLLSFDNYNFLEYEFDKILSSIMYNIIYANKTFMEIVFSKNEIGEIVGISFVPFDAIKITSFKKYSWFISKDRNKKMFVFKVEKNKYIEFSVKDLDLKKNILKKIVKKLTKINLLVTTKFIGDDKMKNIFSFVEFKTKIDFLVLKYINMVSYTCKGSESLLSESYLLYQIIKQKKFKMKCLLYFLKKINDSLNNLSQIIKTSGKIVSKVTLPNYEEEWHKYEKGELSTSDLSKIIINRAP